MQRVPFQLSLKACRANAGLSQKELAGKLGVAPMTVLNWENGVGEPRLSQVQKISDITGIPIDYIQIVEPHK